MPYGCNDKIDSIGNLSSPKCSDVNVMRIFNESTRRKRGHGHRHYTSPQKHDVSLDSLLPFLKNLSKYTILEPNYILYLVPNFTLFRKHASRLILHTLHLLCTGLRL